jgi:hypothetical protein
VAKIAARLSFLQALIALGLLLLLGLGARAEAHKASDSYLTLEWRGEQVAGHWDIALRDLDVAVDLDGDGDGTIRWGEVLRQKAAIIAYAMGHLAIRADGRDCGLRAQDLLIDQHSDGAYAVLMLEGRCPAAPTRLTLDYTLMSGIDPGHRGLAHLRAGGQTMALVLGGDHPLQTVALGRWGWLAQIKAFVVTGVFHIWTGYDHLLFLVSLLLPAVLRREAGRWVAREGGRGAALDVVKVVSAFTLAHSLTLAGAALDWLVMPVRLSESLIAASVVLAAINNLRPVVRRHVWAVAFGFGLIHGFGFANVLRDLALPREGLLQALVAFNGGVELGQIAVVAALMPLAWAMRGKAFYPRYVLGLGSGLIAALAVLWFVQRAFDLTLV